RPRARRPRGGRPLRGGATRAARRRSRARDRAAAPGVRIAGVGAPLSAPSGGAGAREAIGGEARGGSMSTYARARMAGGILTLPARYYTDPAHFALEMERIHFRMWLHAGRTEELAEPGRFFVRQLANASVVVLRDDERGLRAFHNVCRHRGTRLCAQEQGQFPSRIQCGYHGWTYRL